MGLFKLDKVKFEYFRRDESGDVTEVVEALKGLDLSIDKGSFISIVGGNGSGKSTLAKHLNALYYPSEGTVTVDGLDTGDSDHVIDIRKKVGMIFQNPDDQFVSSVVEEDIAFGPENLGINSEEIAGIVSDILKLLDIENLAKRDPLKLSGGQKKKVAIAGALAMNPKCLVLDEASAMLSVSERKELLGLLKKLNKELDMTIINITHDLSEMSASDLVIAMRDGKVEYVGKPEKLCEDSGLLEDLRLVLSEEKMLEAESLKVKEKPDIVRTDTLHSLIFDKVSFSYDGRINAIEDFSEVFSPGEFVGITGHTGSGKSTLLQLMNGLKKPDSGTVYYKNSDISEKDYDMTELRRHVGMVFQFPEDQLFAESVIKDVTFGPYNLDISKVEAEKRAFKAIEDMGLSDDLYDVSPFALSGGTRRKVAIAGVLAMEPDFLLLDEPGAGLDPVSRAELFILLKKLQRDRGICIIMVSHDEDELAEYADRIITLSKGRITGE